jgi:cell division protein FtsB
MNGTIKDITEQKKLEKEKADLEKLLVDLNRVFKNIKQLKDGEGLINAIACKYREDVDTINEYLEVLKSEVKLGKNIELVN